MNEEYVDPIDSYRMQSQLQQEAADNQTKIYAPQLQEQVSQNQAVVIAETDPKKDIIGLLMEFRGIEDLNGELRRVNEPVMNEKGIMRIKSILRPLMINTVRLTRLENKTIKHFSLQISDDLTRDLGIRWREYNIKDRSVCDHIVNSVLIVVFSMLSRAEDQNEKNWMGRISFENVSGGKVNQPKKESWLEKFKI